MKTQELFGAPEEEKDDAYLVFHIDGGARGNPGPAGYGVLVEDEAGKRVDALSAYLGAQTNNFAEYSGLVAALEYAIEHKVRAAKVYSDSELLVKQIKGETISASEELVRLPCRVVVRESCGAMVAATRA